MKKDLYKHKERFANWKKKGRIDDVSEVNSNLIVDYLSDMENGMYVTRVGSLSYSRLNNLRQRMGFIIREIERLYGGKNLSDLTDREAVSFFRMMREGEILTKNGERYISVPDYINVFKAFWHWFQRVENERGNVVKDITAYIDTSKIKDPDFGYINEREFKKIADQAKFEYKVMLWFIFDSGIRPPGELCNIKVSDLIILPNSNHFQLDIRDEIAKTFGRKVKLLLCSKLLRDYISAKQLGKEDYLFSFNETSFNRYLKTLVVKVLGRCKTLGGKYTDKIRMYDIRHSSSCYWLPRYKSESALKYRFGWKKSTMIHYYTKLLGMRDTITEEDLLVDSEAKTQLENQLTKQTNEKLILQEQVDNQKQELNNIKDQLTLSKERDNLIVRLIQKIVGTGRMNELLDILDQEGLLRDFDRVIREEDKKSPPLPVLATT